MRQRENLLDVIGLLLKERKLLFGITAAAAILSILVALLLPVYYKASTTFLAASPDLTNPSKLFGGKEVAVYGTGNDIERLMGIAASEETLGFLIDSFNLMEVYDIDPKSPRARNDVREALSDLYGVKRTQYDAVEITIEDKEPARAAAMANAARERVSGVIRRVTSNGQGEMASMYVNSIRMKRDRISSVQDSLQTLTKLYGIVDVQSQRESLSGLLGATERGLTSDSVKFSRLKRMRVGGKLRDSIRVLEARIEAQRSTRIQVVDQLNTFAAVSGIISALQTEFDIVSQQLAYDQERLRQFETMGSSDGQVIHLLDSAYVPDRKSRPVRSLIVIGSTLAAFLFAALGILLFDTYKDVEWKQYFTD
ncbi:MAG: hypothetical protein AB8F78_19940 [Saprospiraceae bacterium]